MQHWDDIQVGDVLLWSGNTGEYEIVSKRLSGIIDGIKMWSISFKCLRTHIIFDNDLRHGKFNYATVLSKSTRKTKTQEERIIEKIKYLNKRYNDKRASVRLGNNHQ